MTFLELTLMFLNVKKKLEGAGLSIGLVTVWVPRADYQTIIKGLKGQFLIKENLELCRWFDLEVGVTDSAPAPIITFGVLITDSSILEHGTLESVPVKDFLESCEVNK